MTSWHTDIVPTTDVTEEGVESLAWSDYVLETIHTAREVMSLLVERVVSVHILEMRSTTTQESLRALRELRSEFIVTPALRVVPGELIEAQTVYHYTHTSQRPRRVFVSAPRFSEV